MTDIAGGTTPPRSRTLTRDDPADRSGLSTDTGARTISPYQEYASCFQKRECTYGGFRAAGFAKARLHRRLRKRRKKRKKPGRP
jgi:hypothetical protein